MRAFAKPMIVFALALLLLPDPSRAQDRMAGRVWTEVEYLCWWMKGTEVPALVTTSPDTVDRDDAGVIGEPDTTVLFGDERIDESSRAGGRLTIGFWLSDAQQTALTFNGFSLGDGDNTNFSADTDEFTVLARPFFNLQPGNVGEDSELVSFPNVLDGQVDVLTSSEMHSFSTAIQHVLRRGRFGHLDAIVGYRYFRFREGLAVAEDLVVTDPGGIIQQGTRIEVRDQFSVENDFHGADFGLLMEQVYGEWSFKWLMKAAIGNVHEFQLIQGSTQVTTPGDPTVIRDGGLLALPSNIGHYEQDRFAVVPELGANIRYAITQDLGVTLGYSALWLTHAWRAGERIDRNVDSRQIPGPRNVGAAIDNSPQPNFDDTSFWVQGLNVGIVLTR